MQYRNSVLPLKMGSLEFFGGVFLSKLALKCCNNLIDRVKGRQGKKIRGQQ